MKKIISLLLVSLHSLPNIACPIFSGGYTCVSDQEQQNFVLATSVNEGTYNYQINNLSLKADGVAIKRVAADGRESIFTASCDESTVKVQELTKIASSFCAEGSVVLDSVSLFVANATGFQQEEHMLLKCANKPPFRMNKIYHCKPKNGN